MIENECSQFLISVLSIFFIIFEPLPWYHFEIVCHNESSLHHRRRTYPFHRCHGFQVIPVAHKPPVLIMNKNIALIKWLLKIFVFAFYKTIFVCLFVWAKTDFILLKFFICVKCTAAFCSGKIQTIAI